ncbi:MAG: peptidyl-prolyl cis-trans isomerase, partial [Tepidisphaeraceae bacterium]
GVYQTIGGVVAEVNNTPIYADKVVSDIAPELAANAAAMGPEQFQKFATKALDSQIEENIKRELLVAAAERGLDQRDKDRAKFGAEAWRQNQITLAGGSIETARRRFAEQGRDFDVEVREEYRRVMVVLLLQTKIYPRIQVNAADMRRYYNANRDKEFTTRDAAKFEMIMIDPAKVGGTQLAKDKIDDLHARAVRGEDFAELAKFSNGPRLRNSEGGLSWLEKGAFTLVAVEEAVWKLGPGQVTPVIEDGGKFYIARLDQKRTGRVAPFEEEATQTAIKEELTRLQFRPMYEEMLAKLYKESIVRKDPAMMRSAVEIAMQCYPQWAAK